MGVGNQWIMKKRIPTQIGIFYETFKNYGRQFDPFIARYGLKIVNQNNLSERSYIHSELRWEKFYEEEDLEQRTYILNAFIDKTDHPIIPNTGYRMMGVFHLSGGVLGGSKSFYKMDFGFNHYSKILSNYIFAGRYKLGKIFGWDSTINGDQQYDLFYLGGSSSLRGWDMLRFLTDSAGNPRGNTFRILVNWEVRFPLFWILGGEVFVDGGLLSDTFNQQDLKQFKWDGGFGITIATPLAPFRLDFAYPLDGINSWKIQMGANYIF
jgi:outer membrane protein insertion porin family